MVMRNGTTKSNSQDEIKATVLPSQQPDDPNKPGFKYRLMNYKGTSMFADWVSMMPEVEEFTSKPDDIFLASFPKSGTTWMEAIIALTLNHGDINSISPEITGNGLSDWRFPHIEARYTNNSHMWGENEQTNREFIGQARAMASPRRIKTHLPYNLLPKDVVDRDIRMIYVYRNVKDVIVSLYYHYLHAPGKVQDMANCTFPVFLERFIGNQVESAPYFHHVSSYWQNRHKPNLFFISYEELKKDHSGSIRKIANFFNVSLTDDEVERTRANSTLEAMRDSKVAALPGDSNGDHPQFKFIRSGIIGSWKTHFTKELNERADNWIRQNLNEFHLDYSLMAASFDY